jgi:antitoxin component YwqK of YwqJK toxin-antitoxin module
MIKLFLIASLFFLAPTQDDHCKGEMKDGKRNGVWKCLYDDGKVQMEGSYAADLKEGAWKIYHTNGQLAAVGSYVKGQEKGKWTFYDETGKVLMENDYGN